MELSKLSASLAACLLASGLSAQNFLDTKEIDVHGKPYTPRPANVLKVDATLVEAAVVVRDAHGRAIPNLQRGDFEIRDEGKKREIRSFVVQTAAHESAPAVPGQPAAAAPPAANPRTRARWVGLLFDDMNSSAGDLINARVAALRYLKEGLQPGDHVAIFTTFDRQLLAFTTDTAAITAALNKLNPHNRTPDRGSCPSLTPYEAYVIANRRDPTVLPVKVDEVRRCSNIPPPRGRRGGSSDAVDDTSPDPAVQTVVMAAQRIWQEVELNSLNTLGAFRDIVDYMGRLQGDRLLLAASGGFLSGTLLTEQDELIDRALHAGVVIDALDAKGLYTQTPVETVPGMSMRSVIMQQSMGTRPQMESNDAIANLAYGTGGIFFHDNNDLTAGIREMMAPETTYLIGFAPGEAPDGKYHKLKVRVTAKGADVQARPGYMAVAAKEEERPAPRKIDAEVLSADDRHDAPVSLALAPPSADGKNLAAVLHIDLKNLDLKDVFGVRSQKLTFIAALMDLQGNFVLGQEYDIQLAFKPETLAQYLEGGLNLNTPLNAPKGSYRLRGVIEVAGDGKTTSATIPVDIP